MEALHSFTDQSELLSSSIILTILIIMLAMSIKLYLSRKKVAYVSLTMTLFVIVLRYTLSSFLSSSAEGLLEGSAFLLLNLSFYQLYKRTYKLHYFIFTILLLFLALLSKFDVLYESIFLLFISIVAFVFISPVIGEFKKYRAALLTYFIYHVAIIISLQGSSSLYTTMHVVSQYLPILFYFLLFLVLFNRVMELLQSISMSSITDGLTGLYNRHYFNSRVAGHIERGIPVTVLFSDIDNFKKLNDTQGHAMGDEMLKLVAKIMIEESETIGLAGRYGGEEIVLLVTDPHVDIPPLAERIRSRIQNESIVTTSIGYSTYTPGTTAEQLVKQADAAMYISKTTGKNKVSQYTSEIQIEEGVI